MSSPIEFTFNHEELQEIISNPSVEKVVISLRNFAIPKTDRVDTFLLAEALDADDNKLPPVPGSGGLGCPYPPGWLDYGIEVTPSDLNDSTSYSVTKNELVNILATNKFKFGTLGVEQLRVELSGITVNPGLRTTALTIKSLDVAGNPNGTSDVIAGPFLAMQLV